MTPEASPISLPSSEELAARRAFRRGRILIWVVVLVTAGCLLQGSVREIWSLGFRVATFDRIANLIIPAILCWSALRGGRFAIGCLAALHGIVLVLFATISAFIVASIVSPGNPSPDFDWGLGSAAFSLIQVAWTAFALWVLLLSRAARFYMRVRRGEVAEAEASAFEWPPAHRRQG